MKQLCNSCNNIAVWSMSAVYDTYYCDDCIIRGCSCINGLSGNIVDEQGRLYPCYEYDYKVNGIEFLEPIHSCYYSQQSDIQILCSKQCGRVSNIQRYQKYFVYSTDDFYYAFDKNLVTCKSCKELMNEDTI